MKTKLFKRIGSLLLVCIMCFGLCSTAFAAEVANVSEDEIFSENNVMPRENHAEIAVGSSVTFTLGTLSAEVNYPKITFITASKAGGGNIEWKLRNATYNHNDVAAGKVGVNTMLTVSVPGLSRGTYEITITNTASKPVTVYAYFE